MNSIKGKKILLTAGPVWIPIDKVRVITNVFGGSLGAKIASLISQKGAQVKALFGPVRAELPPASEFLEIVRFHYFDELLEMMEKEISQGDYDIVIHSAAVSDYRPIEIGKGKISSGKKNLSINFEPTVKIVDLIKEWDSSVKLVKFKLEVGLTKEALIEKAYQSMLHSQADLIVANNFDDVFQKEHRAFVIQKNKEIIECLGKEEIAEKLLKVISNEI
jgi:phosphopantothenate---cysteine ligase (CTP)